MEEIVQGLSVISNAVTLSNNITAVVARIKSKRIYARAELVFLRDQTQKLLMEARSRHEGEIVRTNLEEIAKTVDLINVLESQGRLTGRASDMATQHLEDLNAKLRKNLDDFGSSGIGRC